MIEIVFGLGIIDLWEEFLVFVSGVVLIYGLLGLAGGSMALGAMSGWVAFITLASNSDSVLLTNVLIVSYVLVSIGIGFKLWRAEGPGT